MESRHQQLVCWINNYGEMYVTTSSNRPTRIGRDAVLVGTRKPLGQASQTLRLLDCIIYLFIFGGDTK
jgi:hypothetical protein